MNIKVQEAQRAQSRMNPKNKCLSLNNKSTKYINQIKNIKSYKGGRPSKIQRQNYQNNT